MEKILALNLVWILLALAIYIGIASIPAFIASSKGYSAIGFFFFGLFFILPALIVIICLPDKEKREQSQNLDLILKYKKMMDEGIITEEEFLNKKNELMDDL